MAMTEHDLINKLKRIQALHAGATTAGEQIAALKAYERVHTRLEQQRYDKPIEYTFTMRDSFRRRLFVALVRKHNLRPYRYKRQRYTTVMVQVSERFVEDVLWPEYEQLSETLVSYLDDITDRVISEAVHEDASDAAVTKELKG